MSALLYASPPEFHPQKIHRAMRDDPKERPFLDTQLADAAHARTPPRLQPAIESAAHEKYIGVLLWHRGRFNRRDANRKLEFRLAHKRDLAVGAAKNLVNVALVDFGF